MAALLVLVSFSGNALATIEQFFVYDRLMLALIHEPAPSHLAVIKMVSQNFGKLAVANPFAVACAETFLVNMVYDRAYRIISRCVHFECLGYQGSVDRVHDHGALIGVVRLADVQVAYRGVSRPAAVIKFLLHAFDGLSRRDLRLELIHAGNDEVHEVALGAVLDRRLRNRDQFDVVLFQNCLDGKVIARIAGETVRVLHEHRADRLILLDSENEILKAGSVHVGRTTSGIFINAIVGELVGVARIDGFLAQPELCLERLAVALGLFFRAHTAIN